MNGLITVVGSLASVTVGAILSYVATARAKREEAILRFKEEKYSELLIKLQGFIGSTASDKLKREFFNQQYQSWLYASDEVVEAMNQLVHLIINSKGKPPDEEEGRKAIGEIVLAMRTDLLKKSKLDYRSFQYTDVVSKPKTL